MKKNIAVMFGGKSCEHDISIITGVQVIKNINKKLFSIIPIYVTNNNIMISNKKLNNINTYKNKILNKHEIALINGYIWRKNNKNVMTKWKKVDVAILCFHGLNGEDGTIQGLLEINNIPYSSSGVCSSAITLNKIYTKNILNDYNINQAKYITFNKDEFVDNELEVLKNFNDKLCFPVVVKPSKLGSSIGLSYCNNLVELSAAINLALSYDDKIIVEQAVENLIEYNQACISVDNKIILSDIEQPIKNSDYLSFEDKYLSNKNGKKGMKNFDRIFPAKISNELKEKIGVLTKKVYKILDCSSVVRIDYLYDNKTKKLYVNELNSIPGSLAYYLFSKIGISYTQLLSLIILSAEQKYKKSMTKNYIFDSKIIF